MVEACLQEEEEGGDEKEKGTGLGRKDANGDIGAASLGKIQDVR